MTRSSVLALVALAVSATALCGGSAAAQPVAPAAYRNIAADEKAALTALFSDQTAEVASIVNVQGVKPGSLKLTGAVLADIFLGNISRWDAVQIARLNPGVALPHETIVVVHSAADTGASLEFAGYLAAQNTAFRAQTGAGPAAPWAFGVSAPDDAGVAERVRTTRNSIGYVDYGFARKGGLPIARLIDGHSAPMTALAAPAPRGPAAIRPQAAGGTAAIRSAPPVDLPMNAAD